jgi:hypothetical protein
MRARAAFVAGLIVAVGAASASAQVEKAAMRTTGISCGTCAFVSEIYLSRLPGIDDITISKSQEAVMVSYKPGSRFRPQELRDALRKTDVGVVQLQISARGRAVDEAGQRVFVAGPDRFLLRENGNGPKIPVGPLMVIEGILDDRATPMTLKVLSVKPLRP